MQNYEIILIEQEKAAKKISAKEIVGHNIKDKLSCKICKKKKLVYPMK